MPVEHPVAIRNKQTTSLQVPLVNVPLSLLAIARMARDDFNVKVINAVVDNDYKENILGMCADALCLGVSSMTCYQIKDGIDVSSAVKESNPYLPVIWGGYHPSTEPIQTLTNPHIDIVIRGQGELTFREVVEKIKNNNPLNDVPGVSYKDGGRIISNPDRKFEDVNVFPPLPYDMVDVERHVKGYKFGSRCLDYYASQGCASGCDFCSEPLFCKKHWSGLRPETVVSQLEYLAKTYNIDTFMIRDSDFFLNVRRVREMCEILIQKNMAIRLTSVNARMEHIVRIDDDLLALARKAGIRELFIGIESGFQDALDVMNKGEEIQLAI